MTKVNSRIQLPDEVIVNKIYLVRNQKVMIDREIADLYGIETKHLKQAVKRNKTRFPSDFMFEMTAAEFKNWRSQFVTSNSDKQGLRYRPYCFTEQGVTMLSCILNSQRAIRVNIQVIRIFTRMREVLITHKEILLQMERIERKLTGHDDSIKVIFKYLKQLLQQPEPSRVRIGFRRRDEKD